MKKLILKQLLSFLLWIVGPIMEGGVHSQRIQKIGMRVLMPKSLKFGEVKRIVFSAASPFRRNYDIKFTELDDNSPRTIYELFCKDILPKRVNSVLYLHIKDDVESRMTSDYVTNIIQNIGVPLMSWNPEFEGSFESQNDKRTVQIAPTIYHQAQLMIELLQKYNWTYFSIVSAADVNHFDFVNAIKNLVNKNNDYQGYPRKPRMTLISVIILRYEDNTMEKIAQYLRKHNHKDSRIYLLHTSSRTAKDTLDAATDIDLTGSEYLWILSSTSVGSITQRASRSYPLGTLGVSFRGEHNPAKDDPEEKAVLKAVTNAITIWGKAMGKLRNMRIPQSRQYLKFDCNTSSVIDKWPIGDIIYRRLLESKVDDDEYPLEFTTTGVNKYVHLQLLNVQPHIYRSRPTQKWTEVGKWIPEKTRTTLRMKLVMEDITWPGRMPIPPKGRPARRFFRIATLEEEPYVIYRAPNAETTECDSPAVRCRLVYNSSRYGISNKTALINGTVYLEWCCAGLSIDLLKILSQELSFDYDLFEVPDRISGVQDEITGQWYGLIGILLKRNADMVMTALTITPKRSKEILMSMPYLETGTTIVVSLRKGAISPTAVLEPYDYPSWCLILVFSVHSIGASIFIFEWLSPRGLDQGKTPMREHTFSLFRSFWLIWAMLFGASVSADNPRGVSSRFLANVWALFALVFLASYTANLAAFMITKEVYYDLSGIKDWRLTNPESHNPPFKFATVPNGSTEENLRLNHPRMFTYMKTYNQNSVKEAVRALKKGDIQAFIYDATPLEYQIGIDQECHLISVGKWYAMTGYAVGLPRDSTDLLDDINKIILDLQDKGELDRLRKFWLAGACHSKQKSGQSSHQLGILNFTSAFILLASGIVLGGILLVLEHLYFRFGRKCLKQYDKCGCCALVSLSMGKSLTFEQSVMEAIDFRKKHRCKDPLCETQLWKVKHQLDIALLRIDKLNKEIRRDKAAARQAIKDSSENDANLQKLKELKEEEEVKASNSIDDQEHQDGPNREDEEENEGANSIRSPDRSMRRSPSYNQAVSTYNEEIPDSNSKTNPRKRYSDGKYYASVDNAEHV